MPADADHCHYHQDNPSTWYCDECPRHYCSDCVIPIDDGSRNADPRCALCGNRLQFLGAANRAEPFWTQASRFFLYPLSVSGLILMAVVGGLVGILGFSLLALPVWLGLYALTIRYGFVALERTMLGETRAAPLADALSGDDEHLFLRYIGMLLLLGFVQLVSFELVGPVIGMVVGLLVTLVLPAIIVFLVIEKRVWSALNPGKLIWLIGNIGWPYLLVVFLSGLISVGPFNLLDALGVQLESRWAFGALAASMAYFTIVEFVMLGYVIYENQRALGFVADADGMARVDDTPENRRRRLFAEAAVLVREGRQADALRRFDRLAHEFEADTGFHERYLQLMQQSGEVAGAEKPLNAYLRLLARHDALPAAMDVWRRGRKLVRQFVPADAQLSHRLAEAAWAAGQDKEALALLVNLHKRAPDYIDLGNAYRLAARIFRESFQDEQRAVQLERFVLQRGVV